MHRSLIKSMILCLLAAASGAGWRAQADDLSWQIDTTRVGQLMFNVKGSAFFRDNEFDTKLMDGYTLPGFRLRPSVSYVTAPNVNVEVGLYMLRFWGTGEYPNLAYSDIANWTGGEHTARGLHLLPFFRVQMVAPGGVNFVLGSIYGGRHHRLIEPLYAPELMLISDPEAGAQVLYTNRWLDFDAWVNWESFIYKGDTHQEAFTFGLSSRIKCNRESSRVHVYSPVQVLFQHRGGELDTIHYNSVQTLFNGAAGVGARINIGHRALKSLTLQADALLYNQQVGQMWPFPNGTAWYAHAHLDVANVRVKAGYFSSHRFISLFGYPFFGGVSVSNQGLTFDTNSTFLAGIDYSHEFAPGYSLGASAVVFRHMGGTGIRDGAIERYGATTSYTGTLYVRLTPSFLLKNLRR